MSELDLKLELERARELMTALLKHAGMPARCNRCHKPIVWVRHAIDGTSVPYDPDGGNHFITCMKAGQIRKRPEPPPA